MTIRIEGNIARSLINRMEDYEKIAPIRAIKINDDFIVVQNADNAEVRGELHAIKGSYLAMGPNGNLYPIPEKTFNATYRRIEDTSGQS